MKISENGSVAFIVLIHFPVQLLSKWCCRSASMYKHESLCSCYGFLNISSGLLLWFLWIPVSESRQGLLRYSRSHTWVRARANSNRLVVQIHPRRCQKNLSVKPKKASITLVTTAAAPSETVLPGRSGRTTWRACRAGGIFQLGDWILLLEEFQVNRWLF